MSTLRRWATSKTYSNRKNAKDARACAGRAGTASTGCTGGTEIKETLAVRLACFEPNRFWEGDGGRRVGHDGEDGEFDEGVKRELHSAGRTKGNQFWISGVEREGSTWQ